MSTRVLSKPHPHFHHHARHSKVFPGKILSLEYWILQIILFALLLIQTQSLFGCLAGPQMRKLSISDDPSDPPASMSDCSLTNSCESSDGSGGTDGSAGGDGSSGGTGGTVGDGGSSGDGSSGGNNGGGNGSNGGSDGSGSAGNDGNNPGSSNPPGSGGSGNDPMGEPPSSSEIAQCQAEFPGKSMQHISGNQASVYYDPSSALILKVSGSHSLAEINVSSTQNVDLCLFVTGNESEVQVDISGVVAHLFYIGRGNASVGDVTVSESGELKDVHADLNGNSPTLWIHGSGVHSCDAIVLETGGNSSSLVCE